MRKKFSVLLMLFTMMISLISPYQSAFAVMSLNDGEETSGRYMTFSIYESGKEYEHPRPILFESNTTNNINIKGNYDATTLNGKPGKLSYQIIGAKGEMYHEGVLQDGTVGSSEFPANGNIDFNLTITRDNGACTTTSTVVCVDSQKQNYVVIIDLDTISGGFDQEYLSVSKTFFVDGGENWDETDRFNYDTVEDKLKMDVRVLKEDGTVDTFKRTENIVSSDLDSKPLPLYIEGFFQPDTTISTSKEVDIRYDIIAIDEYSPAKIVQSFIQTVDTSKDESYVYFNKKLHISKKKHEGKAAHEGYMDTVFLENEPHAYLIRVTADVIGESEPRVYSFKQLYISEGQTIQSIANVNMNLHKALPTIPASNSFTYTLKNGTSDVTTVNSTLIKPNALKTDLFGAYKNASIPNGTEVTIKAEVMSILEPYQSTDEIIIRKYIQNNETKNNPIEFNKQIYFKAEGAKTAGDNEATVYLKDYPANYVFDVSITYKDASGNDVLVQRAPININVVDLSYTKPDYVLNSIDAVPVVSGDKFLSGQLINDIKSEVRKLYVSDLRTDKGQMLTLQGGIYDPKIPVGEEVRVEYKVRTVGENHVIETDELIATYIQNQETKDTLVGYNKELYFKAGDKDPSDPKPTIYLKNYGGDYYIEITLYYGKDKRVRDKVYWQFSVDGEGEIVPQKINEEPPYEKTGDTGADFKLSKISRDAQGKINLREPFNEIKLSSLTANPIELEIDGSVESTGLVNQGEKVKIGYDIVAIDEFSTNTLVERYIQTLDTTGNEIDFHRKFFLSTEQNKINNGTKPEHLYVPSEPHPYVVRVFLETENGYYYLKDWQIDLTDDSNTKIRNVNMNLHETLPMPDYDKKIGMSLKKQGVTEEFTAFEMSEIKTSAGTQLNLLGDFTDSTINTGKEIEIEYHILSQANEYHNITDNVLKVYEQTANTKAYQTEFNKELYIKTKSTKQANDLPATIYLDDYPHDYTFKIMVYETDGASKKLVQQIARNFTVKDSTYSEPNYVEKTSKPIPVIESGKKLNYSMIKEADNQEFKNFTMTEINNTARLVNLVGSFKDSSIPAGQTLQVEYTVIAMDQSYDTAKETVLKIYEQTTNTKDTPIEFNKEIYFKSRNAVKSTDNEATIYLENYPNNYVFKVGVYKVDSFGNKTLVEQLSRNFVVSDTTYQTPNYHLPDFEQKVEVFSPPSRLDVRLQKYVTGGALDKFVSENASVIRDTPLKLNIAGILNNTQPAGTEMTIEYQVVAEEDYAVESGANTLIRKYTQNAETSSTNLEFNRDIFITTKTRADKSKDDPESTIYLDDETRYYTVRVIVKNNGDVFLKRDLIFKINGTGNSHQETEGPEFNPQGPIDTFVTNPYDLGKPTKKLEFTARELNTKKAIDVDLLGFVDKRWRDDEVLVRYELTALDTYTDYINGDGITTSLTIDPQAQEDDKVQYLADPMVKWYGSANQSELLNRYVSTKFTDDNFVAFEKHFTLRTKLDMAQYKDDATTLFLDNAARDYELKVTAKNMTTGETLSEVLEINISTTDVNLNTAPQFNDDSKGNLAVIGPTTDAAFWESDMIPLKWEKAVDVDSTATQTEYIYYKIYYYYSQDAYGQAIPEVQRFMTRYDDMPKGSFSTISANVKLETSNRIEPATIRIVPCDINHVCGEATHGYPLIFNSYRSNPDGGTKPGTGTPGGDGTGNGGPTAMITINPKPTGIWTNKAIETHVLYEGDLSKLQGAEKYYAVTTTSTVPTQFDTPIPADDKITLTQEGEQFIHAKYILNDGSEIYTVAGPYKIYKQKPKDFSMQLKDANGNIATTWSKNDLTLEMTYSGNVATEGITMQYRVGNFDLEWKDYEPGTKISTEGKQIIYGRVINKSGIAGETKSIDSYIDKTAPEFSKAILTKQEDGTYDVTVVANDALSGLKDLTLDTGHTLQANGSTGTFMLNGIQSATEPKKVTAKDRANNEMTILFGTMPSILFESGYDPNVVHRTSVNVTLSNGVDLSYKKGNQLFSCTTNPCNTTIDQNMLFTGINTDGYKQTNHEIRISNIDKKELNLLLYGKRNPSDATKIELNWNYNITNGTLYCYENGTQKTFTVAGTGVILSGINGIYDCYLKGTYAGEELTSNRVVVYPDQTQPVEGGDSGNVQIDGEIYIEESRVGTSYFINTKRGNTNDGYAPIPQDLFPE